MGIPVRRPADEDKYVVTHIGQLVFLFDSVTGRFLNVWTIDNLDNTKPGTLDVNSR